MMEKATLSKGLRGIVFVRREQLAKHFAILRWGNSNICGKTVLIFDTSQQTVLCSFNVRFVNFCRLEGVKGMVFK